MSKGNGIAGFQSGQQGVRGVHSNRGVPKGLVHNSSLGRADDVHTGVASGTYIVPADVVSAFGQGNTAAGAKTLDKAFGAAPSQDAPAGFASGGMVKVKLSGGEYRIPPAVVAGIGYKQGARDHADAMKRGARWLDHCVAHVRASNIEHLRRLPGPKR